MGPRVAAICEFCGAGYQVQPWRAEITRFCSRACGGAARVAIQNAKIVRHLAVNGLKQCNVCSEKKPVSEFYKRSETPDGLRAYCKACHIAACAERVSADPDKKKKSDRESYQKHREERASRAAAHYLSNRDRIKEVNRAWHAENGAEYNKKRREEDPETFRGYRRADYQRHKAKYLANARRREISKIQRTPAWADLDKIAEVYEEARRMTEETGVPYHVDHEIPLRGRTVSGLHVHENLRVVPARVNLTKSNRFAEAAD